jgi:hypothetical protein
VTSSRIIFIRKFAARNGMSEKDVKRRWPNMLALAESTTRLHNKNFEGFRAWFETEHRDVEFSPTAISSKLLCGYLLNLKGRGVSWNVARLTRQSISMACAMATDGKVQPGKSTAVINLIKEFRTSAPPKAPTMWPPSQEIAPVGVKEKHTKSVKRRADGGFELVVDPNFVFFESDDDDCNAPDDAEGRGTDAQRTGNCSKVTSKHNDHHFITTAFTTTNITTTNITTNPHHAILILLLPSFFPSCLPSFVRSSFM